MRFSGLPVSAFEVVLGGRARVVALHVAIANEVVELAEVGGRKTRNVVRAGDEALEGGLVVTLGIGFLRLFENLDFHDGKLPLVDVRLLVCVLDRDVLDDATSTKLADDVEALDGVAENRIVGVEEVLGDQGRSRTGYRQNRA